VLRALQAGQDAADHNERDQPDRQVDVEDPVPADGVRDDATEGRPHERGQPEHRAEETLVLAALGRREEVSDDGQGDGEKGARADPLDAAEQDQLPHCLAQPGERRPGQEYHDAEDEHRLAAVVVGELAVERDGDGRREEVDRDNPGVQIVALEVRHDARQGRADHRLIERTQQERHQDRAQDLEARARRDLHGRV
jgi:hypothetical protein